MVLALVMLELQISPLALNSLSVGSGGEHNFFSADQMIKLQKCRFRDDNHLWTFPYLKMDAKTDNVILVKLGGAILTNKKSTCTLASSTILDSIFHQVAEAYKQSGQKLIIIHGVGSFGHPQAKQHSVTDGTSKNQSKDVRIGVCLTRAAVLSLHAHVINGLAELGIPVISVSPFDHVAAHGGVEDTPQSSYEPLCQRTQRLLDQGYIPVLHGDAIFDNKQSCTIISGDVIMRELARSISNTSRCIFVTDVDGVFDQDPKSHPDSKLILELQARQEVNRSNVESVMTDVTGSMHGKVKWARRIVQDSPGKIDVVVCRQGTEACRLALSGAIITSAAQLTVIR